MARFLDTNVLMRHFTNDDPVRAPQALALIERGEETVVTSTMIYDGEEAALSMFCAYLSVMISGQLRYRYRTPSNVP